MSMTPGTLPHASGTSARLAVLLGAEGSLSPTDLARSCDGLVELSFLADLGGLGGLAGLGGGLGGLADGAESMLVQVASGLASTELVDFTDPDACLAALTRSGATAVTTFVERLCPLAAWLNRQLGADAGNDVPWGRKDLHRDTLRAAGLSRIRSAALHEPAELRAFVDLVGLPVVVKPIDGFASRNTWSLTDQAGVEAFLGAAGEGEPLTDLFAEEFIAGNDPSASWLADYLSVEVFRSGTPHPVGSEAFVTLRPAPAWPFRETGLVLPAPLPRRRQLELMGYAENVLDALAARRGAFHVELKPSPHGLETIEVNGRIGGFIAQAVRYGTGQDLGRLALTSVLGHEAGVDLHWNRCVLGLLFQPPAAARRVVRSPGRRELNRLPGVLAVEDVAPAGTAVHWRNGTFGMVARLWLVADDHDALRARLIAVSEYLSGSFDYVDEAGRAVHDLSWLETISR